MNYSLQQLHKRFTEYLNKQNQGLTITTNNNMRFKLQDKEGKCLKEVKFKCGAVIKLLDNCKHYAVFVEEIDMDFINQLPSLFKHVNEYAIQNDEFYLENLVEQGNVTSSKDLVFTGRVYLETNAFKIDKKEALSKINELSVSDNGKKVTFIMRDNQDYERINRDKRIKIFLCHDSRDKEFVSEVYLELFKKLFDPWLDQIELKLGDSLLEKITDAINKTDFGVIFLSKHFLSNQKWVKYELQSLITKQINENKKYIIPVWHGISPEDLEQFPWLLDKLAANSNEGLDEVVKKIISAASEK